MLNHHVKWPNLRFIWERKRKGGNLFYYLCLSLDGKVFIDVAVVVSKGGWSTVSPLLVVTYNVPLTVLQNIDNLSLTIVNASWTKFSFDKLSLYITIVKLRRWGIYISLLADASRHLSFCRKWLKVVHSGEVQLCVFKRFSHSVWCRSLRFDCSFGFPFCGKFQRDLVWTIGLTVRIELNFQIYLA